MSGSRMKRIECEQWKKRYGVILKEIFDTYNLNYYEFANKYDIHDATIRYWFTGRSFPCNGSWSALKEFLLKNLNASCENDAHIHEYIKQHLGDKYIILYQRTKTNYPLTKNFLIEILYLCISIGKNRFDVENLNFQPKETDRIQAVIFDFDGTLTYGKTRRTTWEKIWIHLDYDVKECQELQKSFLRGDITHEEWCKLTQNKFLQKNLHRQDIELIAKNIKLLPGVEETFAVLHQKGIKIYIVSGSILIVIQRVLGNLLQYIDGICANRFFFDVRGAFERIVGTKYDFEGKARFISEVSKDLQISPKDILFVGDSHNDQFAYQSGAKTLCINPKATDPTNVVVWNEYISECKNLQEILQYIK